jgi:hypothetical protein
MMTSTVVGVFDEYADAQEVREKLIDAGIDAGSMQMSSGPGEETAEREPHVDRRGFFARLFGLGDDDEQAAILPKRCAAAAPRSRSRSTTTRRSTR